VCVIGDGNRSAVRDCYDRLRTRSQVSHGRSGWVWMLTKSNCFSRLSAILPSWEQKDREWGKSFAGRESGKWHHLYREALSGEIDKVLVLASCA
jgi:hypothetical protein